MPPSCLAAAATVAVLENPPTRVYAFKGLAPSKDSMVVAATTLNCADATDVPSASGASPPVVAASVYEPAPLIERLLKVATPLTTEAVNVPPSCPPELPEPSAIVTLPEPGVKPVSGLFQASTTMTVTAGEMTPPTAVDDGCWPKTRWSVAPGDTNTPAVPAS